ncbi:MAG: hypothetical protein JOZ10_12930 [Acidobacteria bacterium]|nr:hypothetical protein [Acidobacteriota bacterium]MBV9145076.1 hypothetical protein [Acidobacteriota bacterium]
MNRASACTISASDSRRLVRYAGLANSSVPEFPFPDEPDMVLAELSNQLHGLPISGMTALD